MKYLSLKALQDNEASMKRQLCEKQAECKEINEQILMLKGALKYVHQKISKLTGK